MSGFEIEDDFQHSSSADSDNDYGVGMLDISGTARTTHVPIKTDFTPVSDGLSGDHIASSASGTTSPAFSEDRRGSVRRSSLNGGPSDELMRTTAARVVDQQIWEEQHRERRRSYLDVPQMPSDHPLLRTTKAREVETQALEEHRHQRDTPTRQFRIVDEDYQVKSSLLRKTAAQMSYEKYVEDKKREQQNPTPTFRVPPPDYHPSERLLRLTKKREIDCQILVEKTTNPAPKKSSKKVVAPPERLLKPTQAAIANTTQWEEEKRRKRNEKDIWWEERRPAEKARARPNTPSKLQSPTKAFLFSKRSKAELPITQFATPEEAIAASTPTIIIPKPNPIDETSHLLTPTRVSRMNQIDADATVVAPEFIPPPQSGLVLVSKHSYRHPVESKLHQETVAAKAARFGVSIEELEQEVFGGSSKPGSPQAVAAPAVAAGVSPSQMGANAASPESATKRLVRAPSERLLSPNSSFMQKIQGKAEVKHDVREQGWNSFVDKDHHFPSPANKNNRDLQMRRRQLLEEKERQRQQQQQKLKTSPAQQQQHSQQQNRGAKPKTLTSTSSSIAVQSLGQQNIDDFLNANGLSTTPVPVTRSRPVSEQIKREDEHSQSVETSNSAGAPQEVVLPPAPPAEDAPVEEEQGDEAEESSHSLTTPSPKSKGKKRGRKNKQRLTKEEMTEQIVQRAIATVQQAIPATPPRIIHHQANGEQVIMQSPSFISSASQPETLSLSSTPSRKSAEKDGIAVVTGASVSAVESVAPRE